MAIQRRQQLYAESEASYGTDPTPTGAEAVLVIDDLSIGVTHESGQIEPIDAFLDGLGGVPGTLLWTISFSTPLKGGGAAGTAPEIGALLKACGFSETVVVGPPASVTYAPASVFGAAGAGYQSCTMYIEDGVHRFQLQGCYGTFSIAADPASYPKMSWQFTGLYERPTDIPTIAAPTLDTSRPQPSRGLTHTLHGLAGGPALRTHSWALDLNREVHVNKSMTSTFGIASIELGRMAPSGRFTAEQQTIAGKDWWVALEAGTLSSMSMAWAGAAGNIVTITAPGGTGGMQIDQLGRVESNGILALDLAYRLVRNAGNDQLTIAFT